MNHDAGFLVDMLLAARNLEALALNRRRVDLDEDIMLQSAVYWQLCVLGEAAGKISEPSRAALSEIPWHSITGLRNRLIHGYGTIDNDIVWNVVTARLAPLVAHLARLVPDRDPDQS